MRSGGIESRVAPLDQPLSTEAVRTKAEPTAKVSGDAVQVRLSTKQQPAPEETRISEPREKPVLETKSDKPALGIQQVEKEPDSDEQRGLDTEA
ncbi:MAG: hypothetical protein K1X83_04480 [Oligoflexia bacterium]|nr:hypothetical protein [Oligoflexia bacterium]